MVQVYATVDTGDTYLTLGSKGLRIQITSGQDDRVVGSLWVAKSGIRWLPKRKRANRKGRYGTGHPISWEQLDDLARAAD